MQCLPLSTVIISSYGHFNEDFKISLSEALKRGVNVYIGYGYKSNQHDQLKKEYELTAENDLKIYNILK